MQWQRKAYRVLVGRREGKRQHRRPRRRREDNIIVDLSSRVMNLLGSLKCVEVPD
jgi:hypothetical protein